MDFLEEFIKLKNHRYYSTTINDFLQLVNPLLNRYNKITGNTQRSADRAQTKINAHIRVA